MLQDYGTRLKTCEDREYGQLKISRLTNLKVLGPDC